MPALQGAIPPPSRPDVRKQDRGLDAQMSLVLVGSVSLWHLADMSLLQTLSKTLHETPGSAGKWLSGLQPVT